MKNEYSLKLHDDNEYIKCFTDACNLLLLQAYIQRTT